MDKHKLLIVEDNKQEQKEAEKILKGKNLGFKLVSNLVDAYEELDRDCGDFNNPHGYTGIITDLNFVYSSNTSNTHAFGFSLYKELEKKGIPCVICTKQSTHDDNGWARRMAYALEIEDNVFFDKNWGEAIGNLISRQKNKS